MSTHIQRDHIFNRSTRPLLETTRAQPQVQVKKKSSKDHKVHGFNDFNFVANQYKNLNSNIGYPYGSPPPSPPTTPMRTELNQPYDSANKMAIFSDDSGIHVNNISNLSTSSSTNYYEDIDNTYQLSSSIASSSGTGWSWNRNASHNERRATPKTTTATPTRTERFNQFNNSGPFIFGVHSNDCSTFKPASKASNERNESVIKATPYATKYSSIVSKRTPDSEVSASWSNENEKNESTNSGKNWQTHNEMNTCFMLVELVLFCYPFLWKMFAHFKANMFWHMKLLLFGMWFFTFFSRNNGYRSLDFALMNICSFASAILTQPSQVFQPTKYSVWGLG